MANHENIDVQSLGYASRETVAEHVAYLATTLIGSGVMSKEQYIRGHPGPYPYVRLDVPRTAFRKKKGEFMDWASCRLTFPLDETNKVYTFRFEEDYRGPGSSRDARHLRTRTIMLWDEGDVEDTLTFDGGRVPSPLANIETAGEQPVSLSAVNAIYGAAEQHITPAELAGLMSLSGAAVTRALS